jgi:DNA-binding transcriptional LysR family regulator
VRGTLRASLPVVFGLRYIAPAAAEFASRHPHLSMELSFEDRRVDLVQEGFDVAVRISAMTDSSLIARKLGATRGRLVASPAYLASRGAPQHPRDLAAYDVLLYTLGSDPVWTFLRGTDEVHVRVRGRFAANNGDALRHAALCGLGFTRAPDFVVDEDIAAGRLVPVLPEWDASLPIYAVWPAGRHLSMRVRAFVDFLASRKCPGDGR